jgi:hypothetical protein
MSYDRKEFIFAPYAEGARKPTYQKQVVVGSTTLSVTEDKVKVSFMVPRHLEKRLMLLYVQSEIDEVKRRLDTDGYDSLVKGTHQQETQQQETHPNPPCEGGDSESIAEKEGGDA